MPLRLTEFPYPSLLPNRMALWKKPPNPYYRPPSQESIARNLQDLATTLSQDELLAHILPS